MEQSRRTAGDLLALLITIGLLGGVYLLPADTSLALVKEAGVLRACVPTSYPPLVTGNPQMPGIDVEILQAVADQLDVRLLLSTNSAMGRDFNPRNWRVTRAQCQVLAGGVVASATTRSFLETTAPHLETGWALVLPQELQTLEGSTVGFFSGVSGLDRIALSQYLRSQESHAQVVNSLSALAMGLEDGKFDAGIGEALRLGQLAADNDWILQWLPLERYPIALGLWKGDLTLKRGIEAAMDELADGEKLAAIVNSYDLSPIQDACLPCRPVETGADDR